VATEDRGSGAVVVTGVSSGIGYAIAKLLTERGYTVFGSVRKANDADRVRAALGAKLVPLLFDVCDGAAIGSAARDVRERMAGRTLLGLVNNAGIGTSGPLLHEPIEEIRSVLDINLIGQLRVMQAFAPLLGTDSALAGPPGRIVNVSSVGGTLVGPFMGAYAASKIGLEAVSDALRTELLPYGIDVIVIAPGFFESSIGANAPRDYARYDATDFGRTFRRFAERFDGEVAKSWPAVRLADLVLTALTSSKPKAHYFVGPPGRLAIWLMSHLPRRMRGVVGARMFDALPHKGESFRRG